MEKTWDFAPKITHISIILLLFSYPLFTGWRGYSAITESKLALLVLLSAVWLALLAACAVVSAIRRERAPQIALTPAGIAVMAFLLIACISAALSPYGAQTLAGAGRFDGLLALLLYGALFFGASVFARPREIYAAVFAVSFSLCCAVAVLQLFGLDPFGLYPSDYTYYDAHTLYTGEFLGTVGNANLLSGLISLALPLFAALFIVGEGRARSLYLVPAVLGAYVLAGSRVAGGVVGLLVCAFLMAPVLITDSRRLARAAALLAVCSGFAGLALAWDADYTDRVLRISLSPGAPALALFALALAALLGFLLLRITKPAISARSLRRGLFLSGAVTALAALAAIYCYPFSGSGTLYELHRVLHGEVSDAFGSSRIRIWREALALVPERPLLGGGPGTLPLRLDVEFSRFVPETGETLRTFVDNAHNDFFDHLVNLGAPALLAYLFALAATLRAWLRRDAGTVSAVLGAGLAGYWAQSFFGLNLFIVAPYMWLLWGIFDSSSQMAKSKER